MSLPEPNPKTCKQEGWKPEKGRGQGKKLFLPPLLSDHGKPFSLCYLPPVSAIRIVSPCQSVSESKQVIAPLLHTCQFLSFNHWVAMHFIYSQILSLFFLSFFPFSSFFFFFPFFGGWGWGGVVFCLFGVFVTFFCNAAWGVSFPSSFPGTSALPSACHDGVCMGRGALGGGWFWCLK